LSRIIYMKYRWKIIQAGQLRRWPDAPGLD